MAVLSHEETTYFDKHRIAICASWSWISNTFDFNCALLVTPSQYPLVAHLFLPKWFMLEYSLLKALNISSVAMLLILMISFIMVPLSTISRLVIHIFTSLPQTTVLNSWLLFAFSLKYTIYISKLKVPKPELLTSLYPHTSKPPVVSSFPIDKSACHCSGQKYEVIFDSCFFPSTHIWPT